ncbi:Histone-lysine N-methyltransferase set-6 [Marasmius tenuissimus]|uniref:Histone-lysine N-methyltransferase set-6 n=1 Tax=Marasmius tenuissimus TaxID=585030 RepID=A0ABR2ZDU9_9AGAR
MSYDTEDEDLFDFVDEWLESREDDEGHSVRRARKLVVDYQKLRTKKTQDKRIIKGFQVALQEITKKAEENARCMAEETKKREDLQRQLEESQKEAERLRELHRSLLNSKGKGKKKEYPPSLNPLPAPPRPIVTIPPAWAHKISTDLEATPSTAVESRYMTPRSAMTPIYAPAPRYPAHTETRSPEIVESFGLLTFGDHAATSGKTKRRDKRGGSLGLGPGEVVDGSAYWTCQTTNEGLPEIGTPLYYHSKAPHEYSRYGRGRTSGA